MNKTKNRIISRIITSMFGIGYFPGFPGTIAALVTAALAYLLAQNINIVWLLDVEIFLGLMLLGLIFGADLVKHQEIKDPKWFVMDEAAGMWLSMMLLPKDNIWVVLIAFAMFRVLISGSLADTQGGKVPGATGIMLDDIVAAVPAWIITFGIWKLFF